MDPALVLYFREQLQGHYRADMLLGPHQLVATVTAQHQLICELSGSAAGELRRDLLRVGAAYAALLGRLYQDAGDHPSSIRWRDITLDMAHRARDHQLIGYALANKASLRVDIRDGAGAIDLADAALADPRSLTPKVRVIASVYGAHGRSLGGDRAGVDALLGEAQQLVERIDDDLPWGDACRRTPGYIDAQRATCYGRMHDPDAIAEADRVWTRVLGAMPDAHRRDVAVSRPGTRPSPPRPGNRSAPSTSPNARRSSARRPVPRAPAPNSPSCGTGCARGSITHTGATSPTCWLRSARMGVVHVAPTPLTNDEITKSLAELPGWTHVGDAIERTFTQAYHETLHLAMYVGAKAREIRHHPDIHITWQRIKFSSTTHDLGGKLTDRDFVLARWIDPIVAGHGAKPID
ncbi:4a-hydroxytetrahydrobiopterin dehydratase [Embleya sp. MST-111070]|uniref:4a-hydroxytetrahydrobiopterin dehydratase n=1 Tax=Embleya sp. MST-111070 TaxID=3398231 RepID=UPI003F741EF9